MFTLTQAEIYILKEEFPTLDLSGDDDIDRYFFLRSVGKEALAISLYNNKLLVKYPHPKLRLALFSAYRKKDPAFSQLLTLNLKYLAKNILLRIKAIINFFVTKASSINEKDMLSVVNTCELLVSSISPDKYNALNFTEKYAKYALYFKFKETEMNKVKTLIHLYITGQLSFIHSYKKKEKKKETKGSVLDFSKVHFTKVQEKSILISSTITRLEDKVIAYIVKYLPFYQDLSFENLILLYSRKYKSKHYNIFKSIQSCINARKRDEELLHSVLVHVAEGYYYSVSGDLYLQSKWKSLNSNASNNKDEKIDEKKGKVKEKDRKEVKKSNGKKLKKERYDKATVTVVDETQKTKEKNSVDLLKKTKEKELDKEKEVTAIEKTANSFVTNEEDVNERKEGISIPIKEGVIEEHLESIKDSIKRITGYNYSIYKDLFFKTVRISIRHVLESSQKQKMSFFGNEENEAEDIVFGYIEQNYENPYQNWESARENGEVKQLGFAIDSLDLIIKDWAHYNPF